MSRRSSSGGRTRPTMVQLGDRLLSRLDFISGKLALNRSEFIRQMLEDGLMKHEAMHGTPPEIADTGVYLPASVGPTKLDNDRTFWVSFNGHVEQLKESVIIERYLIPRVPGVMVSNLNSQEWHVPEELGIKIPSAVAPPPFVPKKEVVTPPPPFVPKPNGAPTANVQTMPQAPVAPNAPPAFMPPPPTPLAPPVPSRKFYVAFGQDVKLLSEVQVSDIIVADPSKLVCLEGESNWKSASEYGIVPKLKPDGEANGNGVEHRVGQTTLV